MVGGIASEATGGNFLMGAATGAIVSLANHWLHGGGGKGAIIKMLRNAGYTNKQINSAANLSNTELLNLAKKVFSKMYSVKKPSIKFATSNDAKVNSNIKTLLTFKNAAYITDDGKHIFLAPKANTQLLKTLAVYVGHELYHSAYDVIVFNQWKKNGFQRGWVDAIQEMNAYIYSNYLDGGGWEHKIVESQLEAIPYMK